MRDADGYYTYAGRSDDMLKVSGMYVSPFEVEATLVQHPAVLECAVIGAPDARRPDQDQGVRRAASRAQRADEAELKAFVKERLAPYKYPRVDRVRRRAAEDRDRQDPALPPARARSGASGRVASATERRAATPASPRIDVGSRRGRCASSTQWVGDAALAVAVVVFLHEGLGSVAMWKDFPARFCDAHGLRGLVFSRSGYGRSTPRAGRRALGARLHAPRRPTRCCRRCSRALGIERPWLFGHSDGGSIALLHAARFPSVAGVVVVAPHIFVEDVSIASIEAARDAYATTDLRERLARYHDDPDSAFCGWNDVWLDPAFRDWNIEAELARIRCPVLAVQGEDDEYGTLEQIRGIARRVPKTRLLVLPNCGHSPHRDQPEAADRAKPAASSHRTTHAT